MPVEILEVNGIRGLVDKVLTIADGIPAGRFLWFRGLSRSSFTLTPSLMRNGKTCDEVFEREGRLLTRFRQRSIAYWPGGYPQDDWEHLFAMQHYGIPTRLLDWSENLFVAAHFALSGPPQNVDGDTPAVWCVDPIGWNRGTPGLSEYGEAIHVLTTVDDEAEQYKPLTKRRRGKSPVALFGTHNSKRIVAQRGTFMIWGNDPRSLEQFASDMAATTLWKLNVTGLRADLAKDLLALGFGETMVFPEMTSLATELSRTETWRS